MDYQASLNLWGSDSPKLASLGIVLKSWVLGLIPRSLLRGSSFEFLIPAVWILPQKSHVATEPSYVLQYQRLTFPCGEDFGGISPA
jgi:hypothetical protein